MGKDKKRKGAATTDDLIPNSSEAQGREQGSKKEGGLKKRLGRALSFRSSSSKQPERSTLEVAEEKDSSLLNNLFPPVDPPPNGSGNNTSPRHTPTPPPPPSPDQSLSAEELQTAFFATNKAFSRAKLGRAILNEVVLPKRAKPLIKEALETKLKTTMDDLKTKVKNTNHHQKVANIQELIRGQFDGLAFKPSKEKLGEFNNWFDKMLDSQKNAFPEDNWVWHDVIRPALMILLGVVFTVVTAAIRPFVEGVGTYANLFFEKPETEGFKELKQAALKVKEETELSLPGLSA